MKKDKKNLKIIGATGITLFSLVSVFTAAIAWFVLNQNVSGSGMTVQAKESGLKLSNIEIHRCIPNECTSTTLKFHKTVASEVNATTGLPGIALLMDDFGEFVSSDPVLFLFKFSSASTAKITITTNTTIFGATISNDNKDSYPLSNVTHFRYSTNITTAGTSEPYVVTDLSGDSTFVSSIPDSEHTSQTTTYTSSTINLYNSGSTTITQVGVIVDYYYDAINFIRTYRLNNTYERVVFTCDFSVKVNQG